jgi:hypothetical protein
VRFACDQRHLEALDTVFHPPGLSSATVYGDKADWYSKRRAVAEKCIALRRFGADAVHRFWQITPSAH